MLDRIPLVVGTPDDFIDSLTISQDGRLLLTNSYPEIKTRSGAASSQHVMPSCRPGVAPSIAAPR